MNRSRLLFGLLLVAVVVALPACNRGSGTARTKVAFITNNANDFWTIAEVGFNEAAKKYDVEPVFKRPQPEGNAAEQKAIVEDLLADPTVKAIAISVNDPVNQVNLLN